MECCQCGNVASDQCGSGRARCGSRGRSPSQLRALHPRLCNEWQSNRLAIGSTRSSFAGRAPKAEHWLSARPSASKNAAATGMVRERKVFPLTFHTQWLVKGPCFRNKPFSRDCFAFDDERLGDSRKPFPLRARGRQLLWKRLAMCEAIHQLGCAHGARTAKLLRTSQRPKQCNATCDRSPYSTGKMPVGRAHPENSSILSCVSAQDLLHYR